MGRTICKFTTPDGPRYLEWSSVVDSPVTYGVTLAEFKDYYRDEYGHQGMEGLDERLSRVEVSGTSSHFRESIEDFIEGNRAGKGGTCLTLEQIVDWFCVRCGEGEEPVGKDI